MGDLGGGLRLLCRRNVGLAFFLGWEFMALYGCAMAIGTFIPYNLEYIWLVSAASMLACSTLALGLLRRAPQGRPGRTGSRAWLTAASVCAVVGNLALWTCYAFTSTYFVLFAVAGALYGFSIVVFTVAWGTRLAGCNEARIEFDVTACFAAALFIYCATLPIKLYGTVNVAVASILPIASSWFALRDRQDDPDEEWADRRAPGQARADAGNAARSAGAGRPGTGGGSRVRTLRPLATALTMVGALWVLVAFFRVVDAPVNNSYGRWDRYMIPFGCSFAVTVVLFGLALRWARRINLSTACRWLIPAVMANLVILFAGGGSLGSRVASYSVIHIGMIGMLMALWTALPKYVRRSGDHPATVFAGFCAAQGAGIALGAAVGLVAVLNMTESNVFVLSLAVTCVAFFLLMMTGFDRAWDFDFRGRGCRRTLTTRDVITSVEGASGEIDQKEAVEILAASAAAMSGRAETPKAPGQAVRRVPAGKAPRPAAPAAAAGPWGPLADTSELMDQIIEEKAERLHDAYGLTERETEVAALLIRGRSRPYIRDELGISLNTVHAHARRILAKCGVSSTQDLIDLSENPQGVPRGGAGMHAGLSA